MAFNIVLYKNNADKTTVDKSSRLITVGTMTGNLREESSIVRPTITIDVTGTALGNPPTANYAYISVWDRYYYINNITSIRNNLWQLDMSVDVLMSFKSKFLPLYAYVARSESNYNDNLVDTIYPQFSTYVRRTNLPVVTKVEGDWNTTLSACKYYIQAQAALYHTLQQQSTAVDLQLPIPIVAMNYDGVKKFTQKLGQAFSGTSNSATFVNKIYSLPCTPTLDTQMVNEFNYPGWGSFAYTAVQDEMGYQPTEIYTTTEFSFNMSSYINTDAKYLNTKQYRSYMLEFLPFGVLEIPCEYFMNSSSHMFYFWVKTNVLTGDAALYYNSVESISTADYITSANVAIDYPFTSAAHQINVLNTIGNLGTIVAGAVTKNPKMIATGAMNEVSEISSALNPTTKFSNGLNNFVQWPRIYIKVQEQYPEPDDYPIAVYGRPFYEWDQLSDLHGYCQVEKIHLEGFEKATLDEIEEIESLLKGGVILPAAASEE